MNREASMFWSFSRSQILGQEQLIDIEEICSTHFAFAALRADGQVVSWGYDHYGGLCDVADELHDVQQIVESYGAFHALRADGWVISWGSADSCGSVRCQTGAVGC